MKIALLGGTFNPIHLGHLLIAQDAVNSLDLERVLFVPCLLSPCKTDLELLPSHHRLAMVKLAIQDQPKWGVLTVEFERGGISYTVDTLRQAHLQYPNDQIYFIVGSDNFRDIGQWNRFDKLVHLCEFLVIERPGCPLTLPPPTIPAPLLGALRYRLLKGPTLPVSSSEVRQLLREEKNASHLLPPPVYDYIRKHTLYQSAA